MSVHGCPIPRKAVAGGGGRWSGWWEVDQRGCSGWRKDREGGVCEDKGLGREEGGVAGSGFARLGK